MYDHHRTSPFRTLLSSFAMLASTSSSISSSSWKGCTLLGLKAAYFHASSICCEKRAERFRSSCGGYGHKAYINYAKRKKRAAEKRECLRWRSCEIHICDFEQLYWSRGMNFRKPKQWSSCRNAHFHEFREFDYQPGPKKKTRSSHADYGGFFRASRRDPFHFIWQTANSYFSECWEDNFYEEDSHHSFYARDKRKAEGFSWKTNHNSESNKKKERVEPRTVGSSSDRETLGLSPTGSLTIEQLKKAFRSSALKWHPDRHEAAAKVTAEAKFKACGAAYQSLLGALVKSSTDC